VSKKDGNGYESSKYEEYEELFTVVLMVMVWGEQYTVMSYIRCAVGWTELGCATEISIDTITFVWVHRSKTKAHVASQSYCIVKALQR
jgi:hypothetical protein